MTAPVELLSPVEATPDNERWHELRRAGITASEIAAVLGISPWESPFSCYWRKVNGWRTDGNEFTSAGRHLESAIARWWFADGKPLDGPLVMTNAGLYARPERPWQLATPDRLILGYDCYCGAAVLDVLCSCLPGDGPLLALLECKWVAYSWDGWGEPGTDEIPVYYRAQALWQLDVLGVDEVHVAALGPGGFRAYVVRRDEDDLKVMRLRGARFMAQLNGELDPPDLDSHAATLTTLKRLHPTVGEGDVEVDPALRTDYAIARLARKEAESAIALCEARIRDVLRDQFARATCGGKLVASRSVYETSRVDVTALRRDLPEVAEKYTTTTTVDRLNPGRTDHA